MFISRFEELYRAEENHTHKLHKVVTAVFRGLPSLNPNTMSNNYENLVHLGIIECLPRGLQEMQRSPRYFPGRKVLIKASELERVYSVDTSAEGGITKIAKGCLLRESFRELYFIVFLHLKSIIGLILIACLYFLSLTIKMDNYHIFYKYQYMFNVNMNE